MQRDHLGWFAASGAALLLAAGCSAPALEGTAAPLVAAPTTSSAAPSTATVTTTTPKPTPTPSTPAEVTTSVTEVVALPFAKQRVDDGALEQGKTLVRTAGRAGSKMVTWTVRARGGVEVSRAVLSEKVTAAPVDEVTVVGTKAPAPKTTPTAAPKPTPTPSATRPPTSGTCDSNYAGACVPIATDVDCAGGSGNGPAYVQGPVEVVGTDIYKLDADHDGIGCED